MDPGIVKSITDKKLNNRGQVDLIDFKVYQMEITNVVHVY